MTQAPNIDLVNEALKHPAVKALYEDIEARGEITFERDDAHGTWASSTVNGKTKIIVVSTAHPAAALYHELLHAQLKLSGYQQLRISVSMDGKLALLKAVLEALDNELQHRRMIGDFLAAGFPPEQYYHDDDPEAFRHARQELRGLNKELLTEEFFFPFLTIIAPAGAGSDDQRQKLKNFCRSVCPPATARPRSMIALSSTEGYYGSWKELRRTGCHKIKPATAFFKTGHYGQKQASTRSH